MVSGTLSKRLELQFRHIRDMIKEQDRMVLAEVEPTNSERDDMIALLTEIKNNIERGSRSSVIQLSGTYEEILSELNSLGYNTASYHLVIPEEQHNKAKKQVHFEDQGSDTSPVAISRESTIESSGATPDLADTLSSTQIYDQNGLIMEEQDRRLLEIGNSIGRQRSMGESINSELGLHNNLLEDVEAQVDHTQGRMDRLTQGVKNFNRKSRKCGTCSIIFFLLIFLFILIVT